MESLLEAFLPRLIPFASTNDGRYFYFAYAAFCDDVSIIAFGKGDYMTDRFEIEISPLRIYTKYRNSDHTLAVIRFDVEKDGIKYDNGYDGRFETCDLGIQELISTIKEFLDGDIHEDCTLSFEIPYISGGFIRYQYFFDIHVDSEKSEGYWVFKTTENFSAKPRKELYSCPLSKQQLNQVMLSLIDQYEQFPWTECGKVEHYFLECPDSLYEWYYSAIDLEEKLHSLLTGQVLRHVFVNADNYISPFSAGENYAHYYLGAKVLLETDDYIIDLLVHAEGSMQMRVHPVCDVKMTKFYDTILDGDTAVCDLGKVFVLQYSNERILSVSVEKTEVCRWMPKNFDRSKQSKEMPSNIRLSLANRVTFEISGGFEYFDISLYEEAAS